MGTKNERKNNQSYKRYRRYDDRERRDFRGRDRRDEASRREVRLPDSKRKGRDVGSTIPELMIRLDA